MIRGSDPSDVVLRFRAEESREHAAMLLRERTAGRRVIEHHQAFRRALTRLAEGDPLESVLSRVRAEMSGWLPIRLESGERVVPADLTAEMVENTHRRVVRDHGPVAQAGAA